MKRLTKKWMIVAMMLLLVVPTVSAAIKFGDILKYPVKILANAGVLFFLGVVLYETTLARMGTGTKEGQGAIGRGIFYIALLLASPVIALGIGGNWIWEWMARSPSAGFIGWLIGFQGNYTIKPIVNIVIVAFVTILIIKLLPKGVGEYLRTGDQDFTTNLAIVIGILLAFMSAGVTEVPYSDTTSYYTLQPDDFDTGKMVYTATANDFLWQASWFAKIKLWAWGNPDCYVAYNESIKKRTGPTATVTEERLKVEQYCYTFKDAELVQNKTTRSELTKNTAATPYPHPQQLSDEQVQNITATPGMNVVKGWGFLHGTRILMLIITVAVMLWVLAKPIQQNYLRWFLAILLAVSVAGQGTTMNNLLSILYVIVIVKSFFAMTGQWNPLYFGLAYMIANMVLQLMFPQYNVVGTWNFFGDRVMNEMVGYFLTGWVIGLVGQKIKEKDKLGKIADGVLDNVLSTKVFKLPWKIKDKLKHLDVKEGEDVAQIKELKNDEEIKKERERQKAETEEKIKELKEALGKVQEELDGTKEKREGIQQEVKTKRATRDEKRRAYDKTVRELAARHSKIPRLETDLEELNREAQDISDQITRLEGEPETESRNKRLDRLGDKQRETSQKIRDLRVELEDEVATQQKVAITPELIKHDHPKWDDKEVRAEILRQLEALLPDLNTAEIEKLADNPSLQVEKISTEVADKKREWDDAEKDLEATEKEFEALFEAKIRGEIGGKTWVFQADPQDDRNKKWLEDKPTAVGDMDESERIKYKELAKGSLPFLQRKISDLKALTHNWQLRLDDIVWGKMHTQALPVSETIKIYDKLLTRTKNKNIVVGAGRNDEDPAYSPEPKEGGSVWTVPKPTAGAPVTELSEANGTKDQGYKSLRGLEKFMDHVLYVKAKVAKVRLDEKQKKLAGREGGSAET